MHTTNHAHPLKRRGWLFMAVALTIAFGMLAVSLLSAGAASHGTASLPVSAGGITPYIIDGANPGGNRTCAEVNAAFGTDYSFSTARVDYEGGSFQGSFPAGLNVSTDGTYVSWSVDPDSGISVGAVIVKGSAAANVYNYDGSMDADSGLASPVNPSNGSAGLSNLTFCYDINLVVSKTADTSFTRTYEWDIEKTADADFLLLADGQAPYNVEYTVTVDVVDHEDTDFAVSGVISITNPHPTEDAEVTSISDYLSDGTIAVIEVDCDTPFTVPAGETVTCDYVANLDGPDDGTNTVDVETSGPIGGNSATADYEFGDPTDLVDDCIDVFDTNAVSEANEDGYLDTVCAFDAIKTLEYSISFGRHADADVMLECGENRHVNTASFETNDTGTTGSDSWTVDATVACDAGCTLTQGYWKTHSINGPAPYDDTWAEIDEDTIFFESEQSYYEVLWTAPRGNAYYNLAHQYIAAELNMLNGADVPADVQKAFADATALFEVNEPVNIGKLKGNNALRQEFIQLAGILDDYNNGLIGPGHCSEQ